MAAWSVVALLIASFALAMVDRMILTLLVAPLKETFALTDTQVGLLHGLAFTLLYVIVGLPMGWLCDRFSRRLVAGLSVLVWSSMTILCGVASSFGQLFLARMGVGIGEAGLSPAANSIIPDYFPPDRRALPLTLYSLGASAGSGVALIFGGAVIDWVGRLGPFAVPLVGSVPGWQASFFVAGAPGLLVALLFVLVREPPRVGPAAGGGGGTVAQVALLLKSERRFFVPQFGAAALCALVILSIQAWMPTYLNRAFGYTPGEAGLRFGVAVLIGGVTGLLASGLIVDRIARTGRRDAPIVVAAAFTAFAVVPSILAPIVRSDTVALLMSCLAMFGYAAAVGLAPVALPTVVPARMRGQVYAVYLLVISVLGYTVGPIAVALLTDRLFGDEAMVGWSLALVASTAGPCAFVLWLSSKRGFDRRAVPIDE